MGNEKLQRKIERAIIISEQDFITSIEDLELVNPVGFGKIEKQISKNNFPNPEELFIRKNEEQIKEALFEKLSNEAKEIVSIILECPEDMKEICHRGNTSHGVSIVKLKSLMIRQWKEISAVKEVLREVTIYAKRIRAIEYGN